MSYPASTIVKAFLKKGSEEGKSLTHMKLQKLVFFAHGIHLAAFGEPLIQEDVKAWQYGPVIPQLYDQLFLFGSSPVKMSFTEEELEALNQDRKAQEAIDAIWNAYKDTTAWKLSEISHLPGSPWEVVWKQHGKGYSTIPDSLIEEYYKRYVKADAPAN